MENWLLDGTWSLGQNGHKVWKEREKLSGGNWGGETDT